MKIKKYLSCHHLELVHPRKLTCPLKRDYLSREYIFQPLIFRGHVSFQGCSHRITEKKPNSAPNFASSPGKEFSNNSCNACCCLRSRRSGVCWGGTRKYNQRVGPALPNNFHTYNILLICFQKKCKWGGNYITHKKK